MATTVTCANCKASTTFPMNTGMPGCTYDCQGCNRVMKIESDLSTTDLYKLMEQQAAQQGVTIDESQIGHVEF